MIFIHDELITLNYYVNIILIMNKILAFAVVFAIATIMITSTVAPALAEDNGNGKAKGCEKSNENSKAKEKNPHCGNDDPPPCDPKIDYC